MVRLQCGVARLDEQHVRLLSLLREMQQAVAQKSPLSELQRLAALLTLHARLHFLDEETFMEGAEYPGLAQHRERHGEFTEGLLRLQERLRGARNGFEKIAHYEMEWITQHLQEENRDRDLWLRLGAQGADASGDRPSPIPNLEAGGFGI